MSEEGSQLETDLNIYFVITINQKDESECSNDMWHAFNSCNEHELSPKWIKENLCDDLSPGKKDVFVLEEFQGDTFNKLSKFKCSIVGPRCLLSCFMTGEPIPEGTSPVFTTAMRGLVVSASGLTAEAKENVGKKVEYMGGIFCRQLRNSATHLVANFVFSAKYERAVELKIPIMMEQWVNAVWEASLVENVRATSSRFDEYKCPVFMNLVVTTTNLSKRKKLEIKESISAHGGIFMGALDGTKVKILIAPENSPPSAKLKFALENNIACVKPDWINQSIEKGYALPFSEFLIGSTKACSTPEQLHSNATLDFSTISTIPSDLGGKNCCIEETVLMTSSAFITTEQKSTTPGIKVAYLEVLARLDVNAAKLAGPFLDGCNIYLTGFQTDHRDKINRILNVGSATRLDDISDALTHVIVGDPSKAMPEIKQMKTMGLSPYFLTIDWLEESMKLKYPANEEGFIHQFVGCGLSDDKPMEPQSPLSKKNLQLLQKPRRPPVPKFDIERTMNDVSEIDAPDLYREYLRPNPISNSNSPITGINGDDTLKSSSGSDKKEKTLNNDPEKIINNKYSSNDIVRVTENINEKETETSRNFTGETIDEPSETCALNFYGLTFVLTGFNHDDESDIGNTVKTYGGEVVPKTFKGIPDFGVVPFFGAPMIHTVKEIITDAFIEDCIDQESVVDVKYYHKPISLIDDSKPLSDCVIAMSTYTGRERIFLSNVAEALGARYQDIFAKRTFIKKSTYGCTHLVCPKPEGSKYKAAVKWKLPAVTADWLLTCLTKNCRVDETPFLVGETILVDRNAPEEEIETTTSSTNSISTTRTSTTTTTTTTKSTPSQENLSNFNIDPALNANGRDILTPKRHLPNLKGSGSTPVINKRLSIISDWKTPPSPLHVATPETPYGQFIKPNPGPSTRKRWLKWAEDMPDLRVDEPPPKRRPPSTPLSELRRQFWSAVKKPLDGKKELDGDAHPVPVENKNLTYEGSEISMDSKDSSINNENDIKKALLFNDDDDGNKETPTKNDQINLQIAQLDQVLQASIQETRHSSSSESGKQQPIYDSEAPDHIEKRAPKDSQIETVGWEAPIHTASRRKSTITEEMDHRDETETSIEHSANRKESDGGFEADTKDDQEEVRILAKKNSMFKKKKAKFMLSGFKGKRDYESIILSLGGDVSTESSYDPSATHLVCVRLARNEKLVASMAAGKWVLHSSYLIESKKEGKFLSEDNYEWGNPKSVDIIPKPVNEIEQQMSAAVHRWRLKLLKNQGGAFINMVALLLGPEEKCQQFERLISAGGGSVVKARPPYDTSPKSKKITHCFIQIRQHDQPIDWAMMASKGILCFSPQYLSDYLTSEEPLDPKQCVLPEFKKYLSLLPNK